MGRVLVLSAWLPEIAPLQAMVKPRAGVHCAPAGIGVVDAALGAARAIAKVRPDEVVFVGTAGAYVAHRAPPGRVFVADEITLVASTARADDSYAPGPMTTALTTTRALSRDLARAARVPRAGVATPLTITRDAALARALARRTGAELENLEVFAVARAALAANARFAAVLAVANGVGQRAHAEWRAYHEAASQAACAAVAAWLARRSPDAVAAIRRAAPPTVPSRRTRGSR